MSDKAALRNWLLGFTSTAISVVVCIEFVDCPVAEFFDLHLRRLAAWGWINRALGPLDLVVAMALLFLLSCGIWAWSGRTLASWTRTPRLCAWAALGATVASIVFKRIFGRAWPDPAYVQNHVYGFRLFHGGQAWESFPSGTAAISAAIVTVLWILMTRSRMIGALAVTLLCVAVIVTNDHWVGDVVSGVFLGTFIGWMTVHGTHRPPPKAGTRL
jgi:hypothetical protein